MARMKHKDVLTAIRVAGYHGDIERAMHLYVKNWVGYRAYGREFEAGMAMRRNGVPCDCVECRKSQTAAPPKGVPPGMRAPIAVASRVLQNRVC
jgi:hypothetical protein